MKFDKETIKKQKEKLEENLKKADLKKYKETIKKRKEKLEENLKDVDFEKYKETVKKQKEKLEENLKDVDFEKCKETIKKQKEKLEENLKDVDFEKCKETIEEFDVKEKLKDKNFKKKILAIGVLIVVALFGVRGCFKSEDNTDLALIESKANQAVDIGETDELTNQVAEIFGAALSGKGSSSTTSVKSFVATYLHELQQKYTEEYKARYKTLANGREVKAKFDEVYPHNVLQEIMALPTKEEAKRELDSRYQMLW